LIYSLLFIDYLSTVLL